MSDSEYAFNWRDRVQLSTEPDKAGTRRKAHQVHELMRRIRTLRADGMRPIKIAEKIGIAPRYLQQLSKRAGLPRWTTGKAGRRKAK